MGGTKNRDAKMKANHVAASGGGGGTKGPSIIDKRNQDVKCPYCDKVYTLAQSGRLKEHIAKQHKEEAAAAAAASASTSATATVASAAANRGAAAASNRSSTASSVPSSTVKGITPAASTSSKTSPAANASGASSAKVATASKAVTGSSGVASSSTSGSSNEPSIMDVGSKAGYYKCKSPKLLLFEWTQNQKRPKPRYSVRTGDDGQSKCKVVLPDSKRQEDDVVVFLDGSLAMDRSAGQAVMYDDPAVEAEQRLAVAALQKVAGDRNYRMLLPKMYLDLWDTLAQTAQERKQESERRAADRQARAVRDQQRADKTKLRAPQHIIMSREKQARIQALIKKRQAAASATTSGNAKDQGTKLQAVLSHIQPELVPMGFTAPQIQMALHNISVPGDTDDVSVVQERVLEWLLVNMAAEQLPDRFTQGAQFTDAVRKVVHSSPIHGDTQGDSSSSKAVQEQLQIVSELVQYGYTPIQAESALAACDGNTQQALQELYNMLAQSAGVAGAVMTPQGVTNEGWSEEVMVLEAIYGDDAQSNLDTCCVVIRQDLPAGCTVMLGTSDTSVKLHLWCSSSDDGATSYPDTTPVIAVSSTALLPGHLTALTKKLATYAAGLLGQPMLHEIASYLLEAAEKLQPRDAQDDDMSSSASRQQDAVPADNADSALPMDAALYYDENDEDEDEGMAADTGSTLAEPHVADTVAEADSTAEYEARLDDSDLLKHPDSGNIESKAEQEATRELTEQFEGLGLGDLGPETDTDLETSSIDSDISSVTSSTESSRSGPGPRSQRGRRHNIDVVAESKRLQQHQAMLESSAAHADMRSVRSRLPAAGKRSELLKAMSQHVALVISGATGCGKSTQVPQYILEDAISQGKGGSTNIICTQPRRISALGLAQRVSDERGERVGETVGYSVRLDSKVSARTRLTFCTTGILLRRLLSDPVLSDVTHVVLDEVHERSIEIDMLLLLLRDVIAQRVARASTSSGTALPPLQIVLMSATADAQLFADYMASRLSMAASRLQQHPDSAAKKTFLSVGQLTIPGFTYPVLEQYLEDIFETTGFVVGKGSRYAKKGKGSASTAPSGDDSAQDGSNTSNIDSLLSYSDTTRRSLAVVDEELINYDALAALITHIVSQQKARGSAACMDDWQEGLNSLRKLESSGSKTGSGAVLVFLPGAPEINRAARTLRDCAALQEAAGGAARLRILPLHGSLSAKDQSAVFARPPQGHFKIVLSTNVAETSITIDDVTFVIDTGRAKEMQHDAERGILRLQEQWISQAAAQQRRGRAGRVRPGVCYRMFSRQQWSQAPTHTAPEMLRSPLESVVLLIKGMSAAHQAERRNEQGSTAKAAGRKVADVLGQCLSPPDPQAVNAAVELLQHIGALDENEELTPLGHILKQMPMDPRVGKMLVYGAMLGCLDPVLTIAAAMAHGRPVFLSPPPDQAADIAAMRRPLLTAAKSARSDHIALVAAYNEWSLRLNKGGRTEAMQLCSQCQLSESSLEAVAAGRAEYAGVLADLGFLRRQEAGLLSGWRSSNAGSGYSQWMALPMNSGSDNSRYLKAAVMAGFYPSVLRVQHPPQKYLKLEGAGALEIDNDPKALKFFDKIRGRAFIHPGSVNFSVGSYSSGWLVCTQMTATSKLFVRESSMAPVYSLLLFGGQLTVDHDNALVMVDDVASFQAPPTTGVLIKELRTLLNAVLARKIREPGYDMTQDETVCLVMQLLSTDGF